MKRTATPAASKSRPRVGGRRGIARLEDIPNVGPSIAGDLRRLGITAPADLVGRLGGWRVGLRGGVGGGRE